MKQLPYLGASISAAVYAWWVESRPRKYHPDVTWPNVLGGIVLTGAWVAVRYAVEGRPRSLAWAWLTTFKMFWATGIPVVAWEERQRIARAFDLVRYTREGQIHADQATAAWE
jgi:hypothetical protein